MSTESFESPHEDPESVHADADRYLAHLQQHEHRESSSDLSEVLATSQMILESYGQAFLKAGTNLSDAIEFLRLSGALGKPEIAASLRARLEQLQSSQSEDDRKILLDVCRRLSTVTDPSRILAMLRKTPESS